MRVEQAQDRLQQLLAQSGFDLEKPDPRLGWQTFKQFVQEPVEEADDGVLFQIGVYDFTGVEQCHFDFVRQFSLNDDNGEYDHMEQLHLEVLCDPTERLRQFGTNRWDFGFSSIDAFFAEVESIEAFQAAIEHSPWRCEVAQEEV